MRFFVAKEILDRHPDYVVGLVYVRDATVATAQPALSTALSTAAASIPSRLPGSHLDDHPALAAWSGAFSRSEMNARRYPPSVRALAERALKGRWGSRHQRRGGRFEFGLPAALRARRRP